MEESLQQRGGEFIFCGSLNPKRVMPGLTCNPGARIIKVGHRARIAVRPALAAFAATAFQALPKAG
jgi:hypothetical protein